MNINPDWSKISKCGGYKAIYCPDHPRAWSTGYIHLHVVVAEMKLGRFLNAGEHVHHKNENKMDNDPSNLDVLTPQAHNAIHHPERAPLLMVCAECGKEFERKFNQRPKAKGYKNQFCSRSCNGRFQRRLQLLPPSSNRTGHSSTKQETLVESQPGVPINAVVPEVEIGQVS